MPLSKRKPKNKKTKKTSLNQKIIELITSVLNFIFHMKPETLKTSYIALCIISSIFSMISFMVGFSLFFYDSIFWLVALGLIMLVEIYPVIRIKAAIQKGVLPSVTIKNLEFVLTVISFGIIF